MIELSIGVGVLTAILAVLKAVGVITWAWVWVLSPLWILSAVVILMAIIVLAVHI